MDEIVRNKAMYFSNRLRQKYGSNIKDVILFGSRARGDARSSSDYDFAVIVQKKDKIVISEIRDVEVDFLNEFDELSGSLIFSQEEWLAKKSLQQALIFREKA